MTYTSLLRLTSLDFAYFALQQKATKRSKQKKHKVLNYSSLVLRSKRSKRSKVNVFTFD